MKQSGWISRELHSVKKAKCKIQLWYVWFQLYNKLEKPQLWEH